ncbi:MAG: ECF transporter S component [Bacillota bacterium]
MTSTQKITLSGLFIALGLLTPIAFHFTAGPAAGRLFLPMHIPIFLAGLLCGPAVGFTAGIITPGLSSLLTGMPPPMPTAILMTMELAVYGFLSGYLYFRFRTTLWLSLILSMLGGRLIYGFLAYLALPLIGLDRIPLWTPVTVGLIESWPGILIQLVLIPPIVYAAQRLRVFTEIRGKMS